MESGFNIDERHEDDRVHLTVKGELDLASAPALKARLNRLRAARLAVRLDLSELEFIDCIGIRMLLRTAYYARQDGWQFEVDRNFAPQVRRVFMLVRPECFTRDDRRSSS